MKLTRLNETKKLFPHWYDKTDDSNFSKHLTIINNQQLDIYHKLKTLDWSRTLEKPIQIWKEQDEAYKYTMHFKALIPYIKSAKVYKNPIIKDDEIINAETSLLNEIGKEYANDNVSFYESYWTDVTEIKNDDEIITALELLELIPQGTYEYVEHCLELPLLFEISELNNKLYATLNDGVYHIYKIVIDEGDYEYKTVTKDFNKSISRELQKSNPRIPKRVSIKHEKIIPNDNYVLEIITWDDYKWLKGFPENDYVRYDSTLLYGSTVYYRDSESFIDISLEEISYNKYLVFRVHQDNIHKITIKKNDKMIFYEDFLIEVTTNNPIKSTDYSYKYYDEDYINQITFQQTNNQVLSPDTIYDIEDDNKKGYYTSIVKNEQNEYVYYLFLKDIDFKNNDFTSGVLKDIYDIEVDISDKRFKCVQDKKIITFKKRYNGYDNVLGDCFDHDYSLDMIGNLFNIPRFHFYPVPKKTVSYYSKTYPKFNNRVTEDDYHYMKRIQYYISSYNQVYFPVLEFWKYYYTTSTLVNRKVKLVKQNYAYLRTDNDLDTCSDAIGEVLIDEEFADIKSVVEYDDVAINTAVQSTLNEDETQKIRYYSINKARNISGTALVETRATGHQWAEAVIINKLYIVPSAKYRLRYGVKKGNTKPVDVLINNYTRDGQLIRSSEFVASNDDSKFYYLDETTDTQKTNYNVDVGYDYYNIELNMPSDASFIELLLESDDEFEYKDVTFERETVALAENMYIANNDGYYNSCTYDLYAKYYDIPTNLRIGDTERFNSLFKRSLPITKQGIFNLTIEQKNDADIEINDTIKFYLKDLGLDVSGTGCYHYIIPLTYYIGSLKNYRIQYHTVLEEHFDDDSTLEDLLTPTDDYLIKTEVEWFDIEIDYTGNPCSYEDYQTFIHENELEEHLIDTSYYRKSVDPDIEAIINFHCKSPMGSKGAILHIYSTEHHDFKFWDVICSRDEELTKEELIGRN